MITEEMVGIFITIAGLFLAQLMLKTDAPKDDFPTIAYTDDLDSIDDVEAERMLANSVVHNVSPADSDDDEYLLVRKNENQLGEQSFYIGEDAR